MKPLNPIFKIGLTQIQLLDAIQQSASLKKKLIECTLEFEIGSKIRVAEEYYTVESLLGAGLIGVVYKIKHAESGKTYALKHTRANFAFYRQSLQTEFETHNLISTNSTYLKVVPIRLTNGRFMIKEYCGFPTLQSLIYNQSLKSLHIQELENVLSDCAMLFQKFNLLLDLSPKNIVWDGEKWHLIDCGPKLHRSPFEKVIQEGTWESYMEYVQSRVQTVDSQPSVLSLETNDIPSIGKKMAFMKDWWTWFPLSDSFDSEFYFADIDTTIEEDEFLIIVEQEGENFKITNSNASQIHPLIRLIALESWKKCCDGIKIPENLSFSWDELAIHQTSEPIKWNNFISEISNFGLGKPLKQLFQNNERLFQPTLKITNYKHWKDLFHNLDDHQVTDIYCHNPMTIENPCEVKKLPRNNIQIPLNHEFTYANIDLFGTNRSKKAILILPGFRATNDAAFTLINDLVRKNVHDQFIVAQLGVINPENQLLVTAGMWESVILWNLLEYCYHSLELDEIEIIAASHGAIAAWIIACMHPSVKKIVLDSPLLSPLKLLSEIANIRKEEKDVFVDTLKKNGIPYRNYRMFENPPAQLKVINLCPDKDLFIDLCGKLSIGEQITYQGGHAATLRHDSAEKGIPSICIDSIADFLA